MMRVLAALFLCVTLVLTSHTTAVARGASPAAERLVVCSGFGGKIVYTDAQGRPTSAPHVCPDCVAALSVAVLPPFGADLIAHSSKVGKTVLPEPVVLVSRATIRRAARAPPIAI